MNKLSEAEFLATMAEPMDKNAFMVIVLDVANSRVLGHRLLNLNREYGIDRQQGILQNYHGS